MLNMISFRVFKSQTGYCLFFLLIVFTISCALTKAAQPEGPRLSYRIEQAIDSIEPPIPIVNPLFPYHLRDVAVCKGPDHKYYLTGTTDDNWGVAAGIRVWESPDLIRWTLLGENGFVWTFEKDATNESQKQIIHKNDRLMRGVWAPEIHYLKGNFWITYTVSNDYGSGLLRSTTGKPEGPYVDIDPEKSLVPGIDATLFQDDDGSVWYIWGPGKMKKMKADMTGFADDNEPLFPLDAAGRKVGYEGVNIYKKDGIYYLMAAEWNSEGPDRGHILRNTNVNRRAADGRYDCMVAMAENISGPYSESYIALSHGGHNMIFDDFEGNIWATMFGNDEAAAPFREQAALVNMKMTEDKKIVPLIPFPFRANPDMPVIYVSNRGKNTSGKSWKNAFTSLQKAVDAAGPGTQIWMAAGKYEGGVVIDSKKGLYIYGGFSGSEFRLEESDPVRNQVKISGENGSPHIISLKHSEYVRLEGLVFENGRALGDDINGCGAALLMKGGGETIRVVDCIFRDNYAIKDGGAVFATGGAGPLFIACTFLKNESQENGGAAYINCNKPNGYHTRFYHTTFRENKAQNNGGVAYMTTDLKQTGTLRFINCLIVNNFTLLEGGNIMLQGGASLLMSHCTVDGNTGMSKGTAIASLGRIPAQNRIVNSIFTNNYGAVLFTADAYEGTDPISSARQRWTEILNCLFYNTETHGICGYTHHSDRYTDLSNINGSNWAESNLSENPLFTNPDEGDYTLQSGSPAVKTGTADNSFPVDFRGNIRNYDPKNLAGTVDIGFNEL
ncbi:MAG: hypothetical protein E4G92_01185 [Bacteroidia bacterium]|nr:MAG: hypothetical protein E4G92_01185 [Bacteroidia bacterium]